MIGSRVTAEVLSRGHEVTAATRSGRADALPEHQALTVLALDDSVPSRTAPSGPTRPHPAGPSLLIGLDADHVIKDVTFENLRVNGRVIRDSGGKPTWYLASDGVPMFANEHAQNLRFLTTEEAAAL
ncbi:hypothetical protein [Streptomyces azureus]|uniref:hypothetical protein n=1 Tax=Streptomyces azureus TaxID=146537 RepID=UPI003C2AFC8E